MEKDIIVRKRYVNVKEVSIYTSLPVKTLYEWASQGKVPSIKFGRRVLFDLEDINRTMASFKRKTDEHEETANKIIGEILENNYNA